MYVFKQKSSQKQIISKNEHFETRDNYFWVFLLSEVLFVKDILTWEICYSQFCEFRILFKNKKNPKMNTFANFCM